MTLTLTQKFLRLALVLALLSVQSAALTHASIHDFHEHDESCEVFQAMERAADSLLVSVTATAFIAPVVLIERDNILPTQSDKPVAKSRSPPVSL